MFDTDGNERVDKNEFLVVSYHIQALQNRLPTILITIHSTSIVLRSQLRIFFCSKWLNFVRSIIIQRLIGLIRHL